MVSENFSLQFFIYNYDFRTLIFDLITGKNLHLLSIFSFLLKLKVISNDELYGHDEKYLNEINKICTQVTSQILINLKVLADIGNFRAQAKFSLALFEKIIMFSDINDEKTYQLTINLWNLASKQRTNLEQKTFLAYLKTVEIEIRNQSTCSNNERKIKLTELYNRIKSKS